MDESCALGMELLRKAAAGDSDFTLEKIQAIEQKIDDITDNFRQNQIDRMREGHCNVESSILYSEMLTDYERIGDHMLTLVKHMMRSSGTVIKRLLLQKNKRIQ